MTTLKRIDANTLVLLHHQDGIIRHGEFTEQYNEFKQLNPKDVLIKETKEIIGTTTNPLEAGYILEDGTLLQANTRNTHNVILQAVEGFKDYMENYIKTFIIVCFFIWHTNAIRIHARDDNCIAAQIWSHENITSKQWEKLDLIIKLLHSPRFYFDVVTVMHSKTRYYQEVKNPHNSSMMRKAYEYAKRESEEKGIPQHLNHV